MKVVFDKEKSVHVTDIDSNYYIIAKTEGEEPIFFANVYGRKVFLYSRLIAHSLYDNIKNYESVVELINDYHKHGYSFWATKKYGEFADQMIRVYKGLNVDCFEKSD